MGWWEMREIKVSKIDYYTWKWGAIILMFVLLAFIVFNKPPTKGEINDVWWHIGYNDCERSYNYSSDEILILNQYKIAKIENKSFTCEVRK
jgi:hypothetical protein